MKKGFFALLAILTFTFILSSCGEDCTVDTLEEAIVGTWEVKALGMTSGEIEFLADGTLIDPEDALIGGEINGTILDEKSYEVLSEGSFSARAASGSLFLESEFTVTSYDCDRINLELLGIPVTFDKK